MGRRSALVLGLLSVIVLFATAAFTYRLPSGQGDPTDLAERFGYPRGSAVRWEPDGLNGTGIELGIARRGDGKPEILYAGRGITGASSFVSGWAVEAQVLQATADEAVVGVTIADAAEVQLGKARTALRVPTSPMPGDSTKRVFATRVPVGALRQIHPNDIVALDANGRLLGRQHYNDGRGGFGAYDGVYDRRHR